MKKAVYCLVAALTITASAYFIAQQAGAKGVAAQASCDTPACQ